MMYNERDERILVDTLGESVRLHDEHGPTTAWSSLILNAAFRAPVL